MNDRPQNGEGSQFWRRLRRRKVVQWGLAYAAGAWGFLQGLGYVGDAFGWPAQIRQTSIVALLIGLPIAVVVAWYHGDKGQQRVSGSEFLILTVLFLLGGGLFWRYENAWRAAPETSPSAPGAGNGAVPVVTDPRPSIAVLPFENRSDEMQDAHFVDGMHADILTQLSKVSALKVISRTSVMRFRGTEVPISEIARQLGVKVILEGGVQRVGDRVRINVQLIDASSDAHLWAENYDRELTAGDIFAIQSEVAAAIAGTLKTTLTVAERARVVAVPTRSLEAWEAYQLGNLSLARRSSDGLLESEKYYRKATVLDPNFGLAFAGLAAVLAIQPQYTGVPRLETLRAAEQAASRAITLDPERAEVWTASALVADGRHDLAHAEQQLRRAIELNPNYAFAEHLLGLNLGDQGRIEEWIEHEERAVELDPLAPHIIIQLGRAYEVAGRLDDATASYRRAIEIEPASHFAFTRLALVSAYADRNFVAAIPTQERAVTLDPGSTQLPGTLAMMRLDVGDVTEATRVIANALQRWPDNFHVNSVAAMIKASLGDDSAEVHARKALEGFPTDVSALAVLRNADLRRGDAEAARTRYASAFPELLGPSPPRVDDETALVAAIDLALALQATGESERAATLLDGCERALHSLRRLGDGGFGVADAQIHALRRETAKALAALRAAQKAGWRGPFWRYYRDIDPNLASIRNEPEFRAVFADIERDMARQRAELAKRPKGAPLSLRGSGGG